MLVIIYELFLVVVFGYLGIYYISNQSQVEGVVVLFFTSLIAVHLAYNLYKYCYYKSKKFLNIKNSIKNNTEKCNDLNKHIEELKKSYIDIKQVDYGTSNYVDNSKWNYKRPKLDKYNDSENVYNCSRTICSNAGKQPFKYMCKYFNIKACEETLEKFERILNNFSAAEQGKILLKKEREEIINEVSKDIPFLIKKLDEKKMITNLGFDSIVHFKEIYFPKYIFKYVSSGGNSSMEYSIILDIKNLDRFVQYLSEIIKFRKSIAGQRALMTSSLREKIKKRDNYTCQKCGLSTREEPNLLLEIDHIIPLSKNGLTTELNLQTLCWKCNRTKGNKLEQS